MKTILLVAFLASTCEVGPFPKPAPQPEPPSPWDSHTDAAPAPAPDDSSLCAVACRKLAALGCPEAQPTASGATCTQVCENAESGPSGTSFGPQCVAQAESCQLARKCQP